jgi:small subunit ribosomal protein S17
MPKRILKGQVINNKANKTVNVLVVDRMLHPVYKKYVKSNKKFLAHDEDNKCVIGDFVKIQESRPESKRKTWVVLENSNRS